MVKTIKMLSKFVKLYIAYMKHVKQYKVGSSILNVSQLANMKQ